MKKILDNELETYFGGGFITAAIGIATVVGLAIGTYKMLTSEEAKIKIPGGTEISFEKSKTSSNQSQIKSTKSTIKKSLRTSEKELPQLKLLATLEKSFTSWPTNFLTKY